MVEINLLENKDSLLRRIGKRLPTSADMLESDDEFLVLINAPGCDEDEIDLRFVKGNLKVNAERDEVYEGYVSVREERPARISETVPVPADVDIDGAEATYENGVLHVRLPKAEETDEEDDVVEEEGYQEVGVTGSEEEEETEEDADAYPSSREELEDMSYRDLQGVAKDLDIKANQSTEDLIDDISDELGL